MFNTLKEAHSAKFKLQILAWSQNWCAGIGAGSTWTMMQLLAKVDLEYMHLKNLSQWQTSNPDNQIVALQAKVNCISKMVNNFKTYDTTLTILGLLWLIVGYATMSRAILPTTPE